MESYQTDCLNNVYSQAKSIVEHFNVVRFVLRNYHLKKRSYRSDNQKYNIFGRKNTMTSSSSIATRSQSFLLVHMIILRNLKSGDCSCKLKCWGSVLNQSFIWYVLSSIEEIFITKGDVFKSVIKIPQPNQTKIRWVQR